MERTNEGRVVAKQKGVKFGRKRAIDRDKVIEMHKDRYGATEIAGTLGISRSSVYKITNEEQEAFQKN